jgi:hypothetical protein
MKSTWILILISGFLLVNCKTSTEHTDSSNQIQQIDTIDLPSEKIKIEKLIRQVLTWSDNDTSLILVPIIGDSLMQPTGFDLDQLDKNLLILEKTDYFAKEFLDNYNKIIKTLDINVKSKVYGDGWFINELPMFKFANGWSPWCCCQGFSDSQIKGTEVIRIDSDNAECKLTWIEGASWIDFRFDVTKVDGTWKISYLQGFDFDESIKESGEL